MNKKALLLILFFSPLLFAQEQPAKNEKLQKFGLSQLIFVGVGALDYGIKEAPMYPGYRENSFFWRTAWGGITYGSAITVNLLAVKEPKYLIGILTEDMSYYLCRKIFHKQDLPQRFGLPFRVFGADDIPMSAVIIVWAVSLTYLLLDSLDIF